MALQRYSKRFWFPNNTPAAHIEARVFFEDLNAFVPLFADAAGTVPLSNPTATDGAGVLTFWAEVGTYWLHLDTESFLIDVGMTQEQADLSTGVASGGELNIAPGNPQAVEITPLIGYVVDNIDTLSVPPSIVKVDSPLMTVPLDAAALSRSITWWLMTSSGTVVQQATLPTPEQRRTDLVLGVSLYDTGLGQLVEAQSISVSLPQQANQLADIMDSLGPFSLSGNLLTANGANLSFDKSAGVLFSRGSNRFVSGILTESPHISPSPGQVPATLRRIIRTSIIPTPPPVATIDPTNYDLNGVLTPVGGGTNRSTIQRVWLFATNVASSQIAVQYGQAAYNSLGEAVAAVGVERFVPAPVTAVGALIGYIVVTRTATSLADPTQAVFIKAGKLSTP
jgi:hypothetical protein